MGILIEREGCASLDAYISNTKQTIILFWRVKEVRLSLEKGNYVEK